MSAAGETGSLKSWPIHIVGNQSNGGFKRGAAAARSPLFFVKWRLAAEDFGKAHLAMGAAAVAIKKLHVLHRFLGVAEP